MELRLLGAIRFRLQRLHPEQMAIAHLLVYRDTVDEHWVDQTEPRWTPSESATGKPPDFPGY